MVLGIRDRSLLQPSFDGFELVDRVDESLQAFVLLQKARLRHVVDVVQNGGQIQIGPGQLCRGNHEISSVSLYMDL